MLCMPWYVYGPHFHDSSCISANSSLHFTELSWSVNPLPSFNFVCIPYSLGIPYSLASNKFTDDGAEILCDVLSGNKTVTVIEYVIYIYCINACYIHV